MNSVVIVSDERWGHSAIHVPVAILPQAPQVFKVLQVNYHDDFGKVP